MCPEDGGSVAQSFRFWMRVSQGVDMGGKWLLPLKYAIK